MAKRRGLVKFSRFGRPSGARAVISDTEKRMSASLGKDVRIKIFSSASSDELDALVRLQRAVFRPKYVYNKTYLRKKIQEEEDVILGTVRSGSRLVAAFMSYYDPKMRPTQYFEDGLAVYRRYQGRGIGVLMMKMLISLARLMGYREMMLFCEKSSVHGVDLPRYYRKMGFSPVKADDPYGRVCMVKKLR